MSQSIYDKVINHYIARYVLEEKLTKYLDIRNTATRKNMGSSYAIDLVKRYIEENKRKYNNFYILKLDIKKYFYSIDHNVLLNLLKDKLSNTEYKYISIMINSTNEDYVNKVINKLKINEIKKNPNRRKEIEELPIYHKGKGLSIGLMTNQFLAIFYLYKFHNYIIHKLKIKHMVIYMDDYILIHHDKKYLKYCLEEIIRILNEEYKLEINKKKTNIVSIKQGFIFLQYRFQVINNKTIIKLSNNTLHKVKKNINKNKYLFLNDKISFKKYFLSINNYTNTFKYDKIKMSKTIDRVIFYK